MVVYSLIVNMTKHSHGCLPFSSSAFPPSLPQRRHLMVWSIFAPHFVINGLACLITTAIAAIIVD